MEIIAYCTILDAIQKTLSQARTFTKLDVKEAFWRVNLDEESNKHNNDNSFIFAFFSVVDDIIVASGGANDTEANCNQNHDLKL